MPPEPKLPNGNEAGTTMQRPSNEDETLAAVAPPANSKPREAAPSHGTGSSKPREATPSHGAGSGKPHEATPSHGTGSGELTGGRAGCLRQILAGRYELLCLAGVGGMGNVYRARDLELDEIVAIKVLRRELSSAPGMLDRFRREVRLSRRVTHPNVARVFDIGEHEGEKFLSMEFIDGESLAAILAREGPLAIDRAVEFSRAVCAGLSAAHRAGVIHRDLKPDNVLVARDERVVLTDFGIARACHGDGGQTLGMTIGTPAYMAPEQVEGREDIDERADIYALGAMLYEFFTGHRAWIGEGPFATAAARLVAAPPDPRQRRPDLPDAFSRLILRCMARFRDDRFATVDLVASELASLTQPGPSIVSGRPPSDRAGAPAPPSPSSEPAAPRASLTSGASPGEPAAPRAPAARDKSVAVLPFRNQGPPDHDYLADELTDDLIDILSMTRGLKVRPRGVVARWKGVDQDPREIGRELGVQVVVGGSVRRRGGSVRINARLISVADGFQLWAHHLDRPESEVLQLNDEVARSVVEALTLDAAAARARDCPADPVALDLFLRGRHEYRKFWPQFLRSAIDLYTKALERTPRDPMILAADAVARTRLSFFTGEGGEEAIQAAERAVALAPDLAEARLALASTRFQTGEHETAVREAKRAIARNPTLAEAYSLLGTILLEIGAAEEGKQRMEAALSIDPDVPLGRQSLGRALVLLGRDAEAEQLLGPVAAMKGSSELSGAHLRLLLWRRDVEQARALIQRLETDDDRRELHVAMLHLIVHGTMPSRPEFLHITDLPRSAARRRAFVWQIEAEMAGYLGLADEAITHIERSVEEGLIDLLWLERCPILDAARADPRYPAARDEVKRRAEALLRVYHEP